VLCCHGSVAELAPVAAAAGRLTGRSAERAAAALARAPKSVEPFDAAEARTRFDTAFGGRWAA
jgi:beta-N-acetylhexosaminidase